MSAILDKMTIRGRQLKNRLVFLPCVTFSFKGDDGHYFGHQHIEHYTRVAEGGPGIVYVQGTSALTAPDGSSQWTLGSQKTLSTIADIIHANGAVALIQLSWAGDRTTDLSALTTDDLLQRQMALLEKAQLAITLGFDGVEFHFGHEFLLAKMVDAESNTRTDRFGGSIEKRCSILTDIVPQIRNTSANDPILAVRMGAYLPTTEIGAQSAQHLASLGFDIFNITYTMVHPLPKPEGFPLSDMAYGGFLIKQALAKSDNEVVRAAKVIGVGGLRGVQDVTTLLHGDYADLAGLARGVLADPEMANKILAGQEPFHCHDCAACAWFTDHTKCPARLSAAR